jgi:hypothetical protein
MERKLFSAATEIMAAEEILIFLLPIGWISLLFAVCSLCVTLHLLLNKFFGHERIHISSAQFIKMGDFNFVDCVHCKKFFSLAEQKSIHEE